MCTKLALRYRNSSIIIIKENFNSMKIINIKKVTLREAVFNCSTFMVKVLSNITVVSENDDVKLDDDITF